jgi:hypothetical protein
MNRPTSLVATLLRKDLRLFWQFAVLLAALIALVEFPGLLQQMGPIGPLLRLATSLGTILLILVVFQEDAVASVRHDWLTRPIPGSTQLLAKLLFVLLVIVAPAILGGIAMNLFKGRSLAESLLAGLGGGTSAGMLTLLAVTMSVAAVTGTVRQAMIATLGAFAFFAVLALLTNRMRDEAVPMEYSGSFWVINTSLQWLLLIALVAVLVVQYRRRHTRAARLIVGGAVALGCGLLMLLPWPRVFALQKMLSPEPAAASPLDVQLEQACFPARVLDAGGEPAGRAAEIRPNAFAEEQRDRAGPDAIVFNTRLAVRGVPDGNIVRVSSVVATWRADGTQLVRVLPGESRQKWTIGEDGLPAVDHFWLLRRADHARLAARSDVEMQLHYTMTLLAPTATAEFTADGRREWHPGIGYCSAAFDRSQGGVQVDCYKWGAQPALLMANIAGRPDTERQVSAPPDYTPAVIDFWGGQRHNVTLSAPGTEVPRVTVTTYRARAHFDRRVTAPGVLGGPPSTCPAPSAAP